MKVVILAGGLGSRLSNHANRIPKPMVKVGNKPIIEHIMNIYIKYGYDNFIFALGFKGEVFKKYFKRKKYKIEFVNTGLNTMTGGRLKRIKKYVGNIKILEMDRRAGDPPVLVADTTRAKSQLGWEPKHSSVDNIVQTAVKWYNKINQKDLN